MITSTEKILEELIRKGIKVKIHEDKSYSLDWKEAVDNVYQFILMLADSNIILPIKYDRT